jgi:hypothetical protein
MKKKKKKFYLHKIKTSSPHTAYVMCLHDRMKHTKIISDKGTHAYLIDIYTLIFLYFFSLLHLEMGTNKESNYIN